MRILVVSDSHLYNETLEQILTVNNDCDLKIHCGDSSLYPTHPLILNFDYIVRGNHDEYFKDYKIYKNIIITHGHLYNIYEGYDKLVNICKENHCKICFHGHTHVPTHQFIEGIHFINPGSTMINRGTYGFGTYVIINYENEQLISVDFYHNKTHQKVDSTILEEGNKLLEEFKMIVNKRSR